MLEQDEQKKNRVYIEKIVSVEVAAMAEESACIEKRVAGDETAVVEMVVVAVVVAEVPLLAQAMMELVVQTNIVIESAVVYIEFVELEVVVDDESKLTFVNAVVVEALANKLVVEVAAIENKLAAVGCMARKVVAVVEIVGILVVAEVVASSAVD